MEDHAVRPEDDGQLVGPPPTQHPPSWLPLETSSHVQNRSTSAWAKPANASQAKQQNNASNTQCGISSVARLVNQTTQSMDLRPAQEIGNKPQGRKGHRQARRQVSFRPKADRLALTIMAAPRFPPVDRVTDYEPQTFPSLPLGPFTPLVYVRASFKTSQMCEGLNWRGTRPMFHCRSCLPIAAAAKGV